jgi:hypothetical protein
MATQGTLTGIHYTTGLFPEHFATYREYTDKKQTKNLLSFDKCIVAGL